MGHTGPAQGEGLYHLPDYNLPDPWASFSSTRIFGIQTTTMITIPNPVIITFAWIGVITVASATICLMYFLLVHKRSSEQDFTERNIEADHFAQYPYAERPFVAYETTEN